jgi:phosphoribosyl 1,2-cyclic phosphate phosphodiesterase
MTAELEFTILGCGSSGGVPRIGGPGGKGDWGVCDPQNPRNRRRRCSLLARRKSHDAETALLIDTSPDMREQLLDASVTRLDGVIISHDHADQLHGIDDLRAVVHAMHRRIDIYSDRKSLTGIERRFGYCFNTPPGSDYPPILIPHAIDEPFETFAIAGPGGVIPVLPFAQEHGRIRSLGLRIGNTAYSSDVNGLTEEAFGVLEGVECWVVDALRYTPHPSHAHVAMALEWIARVKPRRAILTNLHIDLDYETLRRELPPGVEPAYDGLTFTVPI